MYRLSKFFPTMTEVPEGKQIALGAAYWIFLLWVLPFFINFGALIANAVYFDSVYYIIFWLFNFFAVGFLFRSFLSDSRLNVQIYAKECKTAIIQGLLVFGIVILPLLVYGIFFGGIDSLVFFDPVSENLYQTYSIFTLWQNPVTILFLVLTAPITTCCLYYAVFFAPLAQDRPWRGYLAVALIAVLPLLAAWLRADMELPECIVRYLCQLPFHLCACWVYQRSNSIWAPIIFQAIVNAVTSLLFLAFLFI